MSPIINLLRFNFLLIRRNKLIEISIIVTALYMGIFYALGDLEQLHKVLVLLIFNDPALLGLLFVGAMVLFERDENVLQAVAILPIRKRDFILARASALVFLSLISCVAMAIIVRGSDCNYGHYIAASILSSYLFTFLGFVAVANVSSFNAYILRILLLILPISLPFFGYFGLGDRVYYMWLPTQAAIDAFELAFDPVLGYEIWAYAYGYLILATYLAYRWAMRVFVIN